MADQIDSNALAGVVMILVARRGLKRHSQTGAGVSVESTHERPWRRGTHFRWTVGMPCSAGRSLCPPKLSVPSHLT